MRSPAVVFSVVAVSALSPTILGSPLPPSSSLQLSSPEYRRGDTLIARGLGFMSDIITRSEIPQAAPVSKPKVAEVAGIPVGPPEFWKKDKYTTHPATVGLSKRLDDGQTTGGNAHTGTAGAVDGGSVDSGDNGGMPTLMNVNSNNAGTGGTSDTGCAAGGKGATGGNASSGNSGTATGGRVKGSGGMMNIDSNNAGDAGLSSSGCAEGGYSEGAGMNSQGRADSDPATDSSNTVTDASAA